MRLAGQKAPQNLLPVSMIPEVHTHGSVPTILEVFIHSPKSIPERLTYKHSELSPHPHPQLVHGS